VTLTH